MEREFELTERDYRYLFENATDAMWVHDMRGNFIDGNKAFEKLSGYTIAEWADKNVTEFLRDAYLSLAREVRQKLLKDEEIEQPYEQQVILKDGTIRVVRMATSPVIINGEIKGFQHVARDVTEQKSVEEMLAKITDGTPVATFVINNQHKITHWNAAIESLTGISEKEIIGTDNQWRAFYADKRPTMADLVVEAASTDRVREYYLDKYEKSHLIDSAYEARDFFPTLGEYGKWLHFTASPIRNEEGEIIGAIETIQDISEEKRLQESMHYYIQLITEAQEEERRRIARELHDELSPSLLLLMQRLDTLTSKTRPKLSLTLKEKLEDLRSQALAALEGLRRCAQDLRPRILDDLGLVAALEWMAEDMCNNYNIDTSIKLTGKERDLPPETQLILFRIAQEALSNIRKHAEASIATISLEFQINDITMVITDNGKGFNLPERIEELANSGRLGIMGMIERARLLGGNLEIKSESGSGTHVYVTMPF